MKLISRRRICFLGIVLTGAFFLSGCDLITSIKEYFQGPPAASSSKSIVAPVPGQAQSRASEAPVLGETQPLSKAALQIQEQPKSKLSSSPMAPDVLARVGNWSITQDEFSQRLAALKEAVPEYDTADPQARRMVLDELVNQQVLVIGAERAGLSRKNEIDAAVEEFRRTLIVREAARELTEGISFSDEEARAFYEQNKEAMVGSAQWHVREIIMQDKGQATSVLTDILKGADFAEMAKLHSKGDTAANGGDLGYITQEPFPQMGSALLPLEPGDVSGVFKGPEGYYIVKLEEKKGGEPVSFDDIEEDIIKSQTFSRQQQAILEHLDGLKKNMNVEINEKLLP